MYSGLAYMQLWEQRGYLALWTVQRISLLLLQCATAHSTAMALDARSEEGWLSAAALNMMTAVRRV